MSVVDLGHAETLESWSRRSQKSGSLDAGPLTSNQVDNYEVWDRLDCNGRVRKVYDSVRLVVQRGASRASATIEYRKEDITRWMVGGQQGGPGALGRVCSARGALQACTEMAIKQQEPPIEPVNDFSASFRAVEQGGAR